MSYRSLFFWSLGLLASGLAVAAADAPAAAPAAASSSTRADYVLQPLDMIRFQVFQEDGLNRELRISQESTISLPLIGTVELKDKTILQAQEMIQDLYKRDYLVNPQINITVLDYAKRSINVLGSVGNPGVVYFPQEEGLTLLDAISRAGGFTRLADKKHVKLTRVLPDGKTESYEINADRIMQGTSTDTWVILKGDVISVPERIM